ncbi:MAG: alpha/beta fold hydrolase, partial [Acidobacteriota bacterium]
MLQPRTLPTHRPRRAPARDRLRAALTAAAMAFTLTAAAGAEEPRESAAAEVENAGPAIRWQPHRFVPEDGDPVDAELGVLAVPENRDAADSRSIDLHFVRFESTSKTPGSPIVYLAGGPGGSGISTAKGRRFPLFMALRARADVIAFDQRGTGLSNAIPTCRSPEPPPFDRPAERGWVGEFLERQARHCAAFWAEEGVDLEGYDTAQSADDLEALRRALGAPQLSLWGISYGTHLAFSALDRHPKSFDRAILASAEGPDETIKRPARTEALFAAVDARLGGTWLPAMRRAVDRLREQPAVVTASLPGVGD